MFSSIGEDTSIDNTGNYEHAETRGLFCSCINEGLNEDLNAVSRLDSQRSNQLNDFLYDNVSDEEDSVENEGQAIRHWQNVHHLLGVRAEMTDEDIMGIFDDVDIDGSGSIDRSELLILLNDFSYELNTKFEGANRKMSDKLEEIMTSADTNSDGFISREEFLVMMHKVKDFEEKEEINYAMQQV